MFYIIDHEKLRVTAILSRRNLEGSKDKTDCDDQSEASTITSRETTSKSWADMVEEGPSVDLNESPDLEAIDPETNKQKRMRATAELRKRREQEKVVRCRQFSMMMNVLIERKCL